MFLIITRIERLICCSRSIGRTLDVAANKLLFLFNAYADGPPGSTAVRLSGRTHSCESKQHLVGFNGEKQCHTHI